MKDTEGIRSRIQNTLAEDAAAMIGKGDVIASGVNSELDSLREISRGERTIFYRYRPERWNVPESILSR